tara:strand:+ start:301 stop:567 length:267 start_codon:yes stop_codon:yes gene_type:complete
MSTINKPQNPVAWVTSESLRSLQRGGNRKGTVPVHGTPSYKSNSPLYAEPQKREWVGLTDEEIEKCIALANPIAIFEEVEAKLKAKNT